MKGGGRRGVRIEGDVNKLVKALEKASKVKIGEMLGKPVGAALVASTRERFRTSTDPEGRPWKPLSEFTVQKGRRKKHYTKAGKLRKSAQEREARRLILVQRGVLKGSITYQVEGTRVAIGSNLAYAHIHQKGGQTGRSGKVTIPARPYLGISKSDGDEIERLATKALEELFR